MAPEPSEHAERKAPAIPGYRPWCFDVVRGAGAIALHPLFRLRTTGRENIPATGGIVLAAMHRSYIDTLAVGVSLERGRRFRAMAKHELFFVPVLGRVIALGGAFPVRRGVQDTEAYDLAVRLLRAGDTLLIFPEGTRNRDGQARPQLGAARLALDAGAAFVPVAIEGSERIRLVPPRFPRVQVHYGPPIPLDDLPADDLRRASHIATKRWAAAVEAELARLRALR
jgi:1-acyl-sn-glycerol-3-phosphate acyltransferase